MTMELTKAERFALGTIKNSLDNLKAQYTQQVQSFMKQDAEISHEIEARLGLPRDAIGRTHVVNWETATVDEIPQPAVVTENAS